ncbi:hypothetical protein PENFLA_c030G09528 [Penicillium flavigenum]|uniref:Granulins domain-containing protein n=1 Tax=Penicillium flavigenum TaxID=254877 RepID=A0A1V6SP12_9EURO|nr:hypothetical protein PENFLA_c030G09528 [Penicillium flavigenum]
MLSPLPSLTALALSLLLANVATSTSTEDSPQLFTNMTLTTDDIFSLFDTPLNTRDLQCRAGYSQCAYNSRRCCPTGGKCCGNGYCADAGETCCTGGGTCRVGYKCCAGSTGCAPSDGQCCTGGYYCPAGKTCRIYNGRKVCCPLTGCSGEYDGIGSGGTLTGSDTTSTSTETETETATTTYVDVDWDYYYTTIYWTYWFYYWTSYAPYTVRTVTSTTTTTRTVFSVFASNSAEATSSLRESSSSYSFSTPYEATSLARSSDPVTLRTGSPAPTATSSLDSTYGIIAGPLNGEGSTGSAASVSIIGNGIGILAAALAAAIGGLAFGL